MPLIIVCGNPCTGKTRFCHQLVEYLRDHGTVNVELINEESINVSKKDGYKSSFQEKTTRGALKSAVDHKLNAECVVVVDSLNYIKGFRYELYCSARTFRTPSCAVWVESPEAAADRWNAERADAYDPATVSELRRRFEAPDETHRWDAPLFRVTPLPLSTPSEQEAAADSSREAPVAAATAAKASSWRPKKASSAGAASVFTAVTAASTSTVAATPPAHGAVYFSGTAARRQQDLLQGFSLPHDALPRILAYLSGAAAPAPNASTLSTTHGDADLLYELDRTSQSIAAAIVAHQSENAEGTPIKFAAFDREITLHRHAGLAELQRYRRQFVKINAQHPPPSSQAIGASFIDFLASQL